MLDRSILPMMIVPIQRDLKISDTQFGFLQGFAFAIFYCVAGLPLGLLVDRWSRRNVIIIGIALWSMATVLSATALGFASLFVARIGVGVGEATLNPAAYSMLADLFPSNRLTRAVSIFTTGAMAGTGMAFIFGGALVSALSTHSAVVLPLIGHRNSWQLAFLCAGAPGVILALLLFTIREPARSCSSFPEVETATLPAMLHFMRRNWILLSLHSGGFSLLSMALYGFFTWTPALLLRVYGERPGVVGLSIGLAVVVFGIGGLLGGGALADFWVRTGKLDAQMRVGLVGMIGALMFGVMLAVSHQFIVGLIAMAGLFFFLLFPSGAGPAGLQIIVPPLLRGRLSALFMMSVNLIGLGLGPFVVALLTDHVFHKKAAVGQSLLVLSLMTMPAAMLAFRLAQPSFATAAMGSRQIRSLGQEDEP